MAKINLPKDILKKDTLKTLPSKEKEEYIYNLLQKILELNPEGIVISQIKEVTGLAYSTIWHHLEILSRTVQAQKMSRGNLDVYFPAGAVTHLSDYNKGKIQYTISKIENSSGKFICIQEKMENRAGSHAVYRGIDIPIDLISSLLETIKKFK